MTALTPAEKERLRWARSRAGHIRYGMGVMDETIEHVARARAEGDHLTLGYKTWQEYVDGEFGPDRVKLPPAKRRAYVEMLALAGASQREIGHTLGVSPGTVNADLSRVQDRTPAEKSPLVEALTGAIEEAEKRAETAGVAAPAPDVEQASNPPSGTAPEGGLMTPPSGAPTTDHLASVAVAGPGETAGDVQPSPAISLAPSGFSGEEKENAGGGAATPPPAPTGSPCEKCGIDVGAGPAADGYRQCSLCDPDGEHVADADGICRLCAAVATVPDAYLALVIAEGRSGLHLQCTTCGQLVAHLLPGEQLPLVLVEAHRHDCI